MKKKYWDDMKDGERLSCRPVVFTREEIINFAKRYDPQPFHVDEEIAKASIFGGLIASSLHTISACTRVVVDAQGEMAIMSGLGIDEVKLFNPVRPGDVLSVDAYWSDLKRSRSKPDRGIVNLKCKVSNQRGEPVAEYGYKYLVGCRTT
ncbi:MAG: MaoC family dehydratase [Deltaproteobacteria bacterium]|nr:MaoC family dehydratase [Deltaproteobacteria bacterium]